MNKRVRIILRFTFIKMRDRSRLRTNKSIICVLVLKQCNKGSMTHANLICEVTPFGLFPKSDYTQVLHVCTPSCQSSLRLQPPNDINSTGRASGAGESLKVTSKKIWEQQSTVWASRRRNNTIHRLRAVINVRWQMVALVQEIKFNLLVRNQRETIQTFNLIPHRDDCNRRRLDANAAATYRGRLCLDISIISAPVPSNIKSHFFPP